MTYEETLRSFQEVRCVLVVGHESSSPGAINIHTSNTEYQFNSALCQVIMSKMFHTEVLDLEREENSHMSLTSTVNALNPHFTLEMHCNAFNRPVSGTEVLYYDGSVMGERIARIFLRHMVKCLGLPDRGVKPRVSADRGGYFLARTKAPAIIVEPFFIDNDWDLLLGRYKFEALADAYVAAIDEAAKLFKVVGGEVTQCIEAVSEESSYYDKQLFLAGGIVGCSDWQSEALSRLEGLEITILNPRQKNFPIDDLTAAPKQITWEFERLKVATHILFWFSPETVCPIVLYELGRYLALHKAYIYIGVHPDYSRKLDVEIQSELACPRREIYYSLESLCDAVREDIES